jgi:RNA polymerase sigma factor (sigma-70 family)
MSLSITFPLLRAQSDARLLELARDGHERAFEALVQRYRKPLLAYCRRLLLPEARAEDALQQALMQAWIALESGREVRDPKAWLYRIVHNTAISALRRSGYDYVELDESLHGAEAPESDLERRIAVREALAGIAALPDGQRDVLLRTAVQGESHEQVAAALGLSEGAVRGLIYRARATLRAAATAVTPPQLVLWAARAAESGSHLQTAEVAGGAGSAGMLGLLLKGGAVVVSAGVLATGTGLVGHGASAVDPARADQSGREAHGPAAGLDSAALGGRLSPAESSALTGVIGEDGGRHGAGEGSRRDHGGSTDGSGRDGRSGGEGARDGSGTLDGHRSDGGSAGGTGDTGDTGGSSGGSGTSGSGDASHVLSTSDGGSGSGSASNTDPSATDGGSGSDGGQAPAASEPVEAVSTTSTSDGGSGSGGDSTSGSNDGSELSSSSGSGH